MKISSAGYDIDVSKDNITVNFKNTFFEGINVRDLYTDVGYALSERGRLIDKANTPVLD